MPAEHVYVPTMASLMTAEDLLRTNLPDKRTELVRGRLVVHEPAGGRHGSVAMNLAIRLGQHIDLTGAGQLFAAETGFTQSLATHECDVRRAKIGDWLEAAAQLVWVIDP